MPYALAILSSQLQRRAGGAPLDRETYRGRA
jgi:hypothetical protein